MNRQITSSPVKGILDGLAFLTAEALRCRRVDVAQTLVEALHRIDALEDDAGGLPCEFRAKGKGI